MASRFAGPAVHGRTAPQGTGRASVPELAGPWGIVSCVYIPRQIEQTTALFQETSWSFGAAAGKNCCMNKPDCDNIFNIYNVSNIIVENK